MMRLLRPTHSGIFLRSFRLHSTHYARETIAKICSLWALRSAVRAARKPGVAFHGHSCDACVAPLATAIISQTGSYALPARPPGAPSGRHSRATRPGLGSRERAVDLIAWVASGTLAAAWRGGRVVEGARLESE